MNILITGAAGGIGSTLAYELFKNGHELSLVDNLYNGYKENLQIDGITYGKFYEEDIRNTTSIKNIIKENNVTHVIHLAAITSLPACEENPSECLSVNVNGTLSILEASRATGISRVVFSSTSAVYEKNDDAEAFTEEAEVHPRLFYSLSKKLAEELCVTFEKNYGMEVPILRYFNVFGPRQDIYRKSPPLINYLVREFINNRTPILHSDGTQLRDYIYVNDVCDFTQLALTHKVAPNNKWNVCSGELISLQEIVNIVKQTMQVSITPVYRSPSHFWDEYPLLFSDPYPLKKHIVEEEVIRTCAGSNNKSKLLLDWSPRADVRTCIATTVREIATKFYNNL